MKTAIVGVGSIIFEDEGVGIYASKYLDENYTFKGDVALVDGGVIGLGLMNYFLDYDRVLILDTITMDDEIGSIYSLPSEELLGLGSYKQTAHEVEVIETLEICSLLEIKADVNIIGIVPKDIESVNIGLSDEIKERFDDFISVVITELDRLGVKYEKHTDEVTLQSIIENYSNPISDNR